MVLWLWFSKPWVTFALWKLWRSWVWNEVVLYCKSGGRIEVWGFGFLLRFRLQGMLERIEKHSISKPQKKDYWAYSFSYFMDGVFLWIRWEYIPSGLNPSTPWILSQQHWEQKIHSFTFTATINRIKKSAHLAKG